MCPLPSVFLDPPWLRGGKGADGVLPPADDAPRLVWNEGERERFVAEIPPPKRKPHVDHDDDIIDSMLDAIDSGRSYRDAKVASLTDAALLDVIAEMPRKLTSKSAMHILGRVDAAAAPLIAVAKAYPSDVLLKALQPIESPELAPIVVKIEARIEFSAPSVEMLRTHPWTATDGQRWLLRHAKAACVGLVPTALDAEDAAHEDARRALEFLAAQGEGVALDAALARHGEGCAAYVSSLRPLLSLAALVDRPGCDHIGALLFGGFIDPVLDLLEDVDEPGVALAMARWLSEGTLSRRGRAAEWLTRHPVAARKGLETLEPGEGVRSLAEKILDGTTTVEEDDALQRVPERIPAAPAFFDAAALPAPELIEGERLTPSHVEHIGTMLRFTPLEPPYPGLVQTKSACTPESLDGFALALFEAWDAADAPTSDKWAMRGVGLLGGESSAAALVKRIRSWAYQSQRADGYQDERRGQDLALRGVEALGANGSETALVHLDDLARSAGAGWMRRAAAAALESVRLSRALPMARFEEELLPDFDLDAEGKMTLDLGGRSVTLRFDETLSPRLTREDGTLVRSFPRIRKDDDERLHGDAKRRYSDVRAAVKALAKRTLRRLEQAMNEEYRWTPEAWRTQLASHSLLQHVTRALVWGLYTAEGELQSAFRLTADGTLATLGDELLPVHDGSKVELLHTLAFEDDVSKWGDIFTDYELLQPFDQIRRETFKCPPSQGQATEFKATKTEVSAGQVFALRHRGWAARPGYVLSGSSPVRTGNWHAPPRLFERRLPDGHDAWIEFDQPIVSTKETPTVEVVKILSGVRLGALSPIAYSELARDVARLTS